MPFLEIKFFMRIMNTFLNEMPYTDALPHAYRGEIRPLYPQCLENHPTIGGIPNRALLLRKTLKKHQNDIDRLYDKVPEKREGKNKEIDSDREALLASMIEEMGDPIGYLEGYSFQENIDSETASEVVSCLKGQLKILEERILNLTEKEGGPFAGGRFSLSAQALRGHLSKVFRKLFAEYDVHAKNNKPDEVVKYVLGEIDKLRLLGELRIAQPNLYKDWINTLQIAKESKAKTAELEELLQGIMISMFIEWEDFWGISSKITNEQLAAIFEAMQFHFIIKLRETLIRNKIIEATSVDVHDNTTSISQTKASPPLSAACHPF